METATEPKPEVMPPRRGPKTARGKSWSSRNAITHGIFVDNVLADESETEYNERLVKWRESLQPANEAEEALVGRLVMLFWRYRPLVIAETAEITRGRERLEWNPRNLLAKMPLAEVCGMQQIAENALEIGAMAGVLTDIRKEIEEHGPDWERDRRLLIRIYGGSESVPVGPINTIYRRIDPQNKQELQNELLAAIDQEVKEINERACDKRLSDSHKEDLRQIIALVPQGRTADNLGLYELRLDRAIERTFRRLERLQDRRKAAPRQPQMNTTSADEHVAEATAL